jgi:hypothetical protein
VNHLEARTCGAQAARRLDRGSHFSARRFLPVGSIPVFSSRRCDPWRRDSIERRPLCAVGVRAVYASLEEETALREVTSRKSALGGRSQISVGEYPRITYILSVATKRNLDLAVKLASELANVVRLCLRRPEHSVSQELASIWISEGIDSVVFPSATGTGRNVAVYLANAAAGSVVVRNRAEVLAALRRPPAGKRSR